MQIVSNGDNLHEMSNPVLWGKNKNNVINFSSAELAQRVIRVKTIFAELSTLKDFIKMLLYVHQQHSNSWRSA